ncbi:MAG: hypothetical protein Q9227_006873 [Pyrenula ochraceoflavens]
MAAISGWAAINPEDRIDGGQTEIDDTREIQIEDALKLYQNALKLHSQGPEFYEQADAAYRELFQSELFRSPDAISQYHEEVQAANLSSAHTANGAVGNADVAPAGPATAADESHSSIPQILYLAHKNRGQLTLDMFQGLLERAQNDETQLQLIKDNMWFATRKALNDFAEALERDDTDLDLWRKVARISHVLSSRRLGRFCLESVFVSDEGGVDDPDVLGLDEAFAIGDLREATKTLKDDLSLSQLPKTHIKSVIYSAMRQRLDPYPYLPARSLEIDYPDPRSRPLGFQPMRHPLRPTARSWVAVGLAIYQALAGDDEFMFDLGPGASLAIELPGGIQHSPSPETHYTTAPDTEKSTWEDSDLLSNGASKIANTKEAIQDNAKPDVNAHPDDPARNSPDDSDLIDKQAAAQLSDQIASSTSKDQNSDETATKNTEATDEAQQITLPTRKRSSTSAGNDDTLDGGRAKSRRIRAREANAEIAIQEEDTANNMAQAHEDRFEEFACYDRLMFDTAAELLAKCGVEDHGTMEEMKNAINGCESPTDEQQKAEFVVAQDIRDAIYSWSEERGHALINGDGLLDPRGQFADTQSAGIAMFLEHSKPNQRKAEAEVPMVEDEGLDRFVRNINADWCYSHEVALRWVESLLSSTRRINNSSDTTSDQLGRSPYMRYIWSQALKQMVVQIILKEDEYIYRVLKFQADQLERRILETPLGNNPLWTEHDLDLTELVQSLYELHLDIFTLITHPNSEVDLETRTVQEHRLGRWCNMSCFLITEYSKNLPREDLGNRLILRFMWAATTHGNRAEDVSQEHRLLCLQDLRGLLEAVGSPVILLQNNAAMPEISIYAVDQEISRLSTLEFFTSIFSNDVKDPFTVIDSLEPILDPAQLEFSAAAQNDDLPVHDVSQESDSRIPKLRAFLDQGDASLKLFLWKRLEEAYSSLGLQSQIVSCHLRMLTTILDEIKSPLHCKKTRNERILALMNWLHRLDTLMVQLLLSIFNDDGAFDSVYYEHLQSSMATVSQLARVLHSFALIDDSLRIGASNAPQLKNANAGKLFETFRGRLREMQIRVWLLQYALIKEGINQNKDKFPAPFDDRARYLRFVHNALGERGYCRYSNKLLVKIMKADLLSMPTEDDYEPEISQVLFDLHQLRFAPGVGDTDHDCSPENLDRPTALKLVPYVMTQANRMNIRDLIKSDLKNTIDKMQAVIGPPKPSSALLQNRKALSAYLKSAVNPQDLYRSIQGIGDLSTKMLQGENADIASHGWYYLQGYMALTKFKSVKRVNPTPTVDIDVAGAFFKQDLEYDSEKWETWWRYAQCFEAKVEDDVLWTAEKLNNHRAELATLQRNAIHCYSMAIAVAMRAADESALTRNKISDIFTEFATLLYSASREPLSMDAFSLTGFERHFSSQTTQQMYKAPPFSAMRPYSVWSFSRRLLRQAMVEKPNRWYNHYLSGKCLWKMYTDTRSATFPPLKSKPSVDDVLNTLVETISKLPERRDSRAEPILEPHFKLVSIVHKLVRGGIIDARRAETILQATPYARKEHLSADEDGGGWEEYVLLVLQNLEKADKSNWHHRITARAAHIVYEDGRNQLTAAGAFHKITQHIFTKTMTLQVWKPENERPGRHFVYTSRYVLFLLRLLDQLRAKEYRENFEPLARRIRRKQGEFLDHQHIWEELCTTYVRVLRAVGSIPEGSADTVFKGSNYEEYSRVSESLERWAHDELTENANIGILREALELKKLNNNFMKGTLLDDLVLDGYAILYEIYMRQEEEKAAEKKRLDADAVADRPIDGVPGSHQEPANDAGAIIQVDGESKEAATSAARPDAKEPVGGESGDSSVHGKAGEAGPSPFWPYPNPVPHNQMQRASPGPHGNPPFAANPLSVQTMNTTAPPKPHLGRPKTITKRELQRKAEALIAKPPPIPTPKLLNAPGLPSGKTRVSVEVPASPSVRKDISKGDSSGGKGQEENGDGPASTGRMQGQETEEIASRRSSMGDRWDMGAEADNENASSELSEIGEDMDENDDGRVLDKEGGGNGGKQAKLLFPNLARADAGDTSSVMESEDVSMVDAVEEIEEDEEGEGEVEDEEGEDGGGEETAEVEEEGNEPGDSQDERGRMPGQWVDSQPTE